MGEGWTIELPNNQNVTADDGWEYEVPQKPGLITSLSADKKTYLQSPEPEQSTFDRVAGMAGKAVRMDPLGAVGDAFDLIVEQFPESPYADRQQAHVALQAAKEFGIAPSMVDKEIVRKYTEKQGVYTQPTNKQMTEGLMAAGLAFGGAEAMYLGAFGRTLWGSEVAGKTAEGVWGALKGAGGVARAVGIFAGLMEAENYAVSKSRNEAYKFGAGKGLADLTPDGTSEALKDILTLTDLTWQAVATGGINTAAKGAVDKFTSQFMRELVIKHNLPRSVYISPEQIREFHGLGREDVISPEISAMLKDANLSRADYVNGLKNGIDLEIPVEKLVINQDKPWVKNLKQFFKITPYENVTVVPAGGPTAKTPVAGLLEGADKTTVDKISENELIYNYEKVQDGQRGDIVSEAEGLPPESGNLFGGTGGNISRPEVGVETVGKYKAEKIKIESSFDLARLADANIGRQAQENFISVITDKNNKILRIYRHSLGMQNYAPGIPSLIAGNAINTPGAFKVWLAHNHPAGDPKFSREDQNFSDQINNILRGTGVKYGDFIAVGNEKFSSESIGVAGIGKYETSKRIPLSERVFINRVNSEKNISMAVDAIEYSRKNNANGMILLDNKNRPVSIVGADKFTEIRGDIQRRALGEIDKRNAAAMIVTQLDRIISEPEAQNIKAFAGAANLRLLDIIDKNGSHSEKGINMSGRDIYFYSGLDITQTANVIKGLVENIKEATPYIEAFARQVWDEGSRAAESFMARAKELLGEIWNKVKDAVSRAWDKLNETRGSFSWKDTAREKADYEALKKEADKAGKDVYEYMIETGVDEQAASRMIELDKRTSGAYHNDKGVDAHGITGQQAPAGAGYRPGIDAGRYQENRRARVQALRSRQESAGNVWTEHDQALAEKIFSGESYAEYLHHATYKEKILGILKEGLSPDKSGNYHYTDNMGKRVSLADNADFANDFGNILLRVRLDDLDAAQMKLIERVGGIEVNYFDVIPPDKFDIFIKGEWINLKAWAEDATKPRAREIPDNINELLSLAAKQDKATGAAVLGENPSYDAIRQKAAQMAFEKIQKKIDFQKRKEAAALRRQGEADARITPAFQAMTHIINNGGMSKKALLADYDKDTVKELVRKRPGLVTESGKAGPDVYADQFGFESGDDMVNAFLDWRGIKDEGGKAAKDFLDNYGELISKAESADYHVDLLMEEEKILAGLMRDYKPKPAKGLKAFIAKETGQTRVDELMVSEYEALTAAMKKAEQASRKAFREGNISGALAEKTRQRELAELKKAKLEAKKEATEIHDSILKIMKDDKIPVEYKDKIEDFLSDYDLYPRSNRTRDRLESTREFLERLEMNGEEVNIPKSLLNKIERYGRIHWRDLSLEQLRDISDQVKMLAHLGRMKATLIAEKEARDFDAAISAITGNIKKNWPGVNAEPTAADVENMLLEKSAINEMLSKNTAYQAELTKPEYIFRRLDRWEELGPTWRAMYKPLADAYNTEVTDLNIIIKTLQDMFRPFTEKHAGKWAREKYKIPGVPQILTKEKMIMVALNSGNEGNLKALKEGYQWDDAQIDAIISKLAPQEWRLVNDVWKVFESQYPKLADVYNKLTGAELGRVQGNYFPLVFDRTLSWLADKNAAEAELRDFFKTIYTKADVKTGTVIERKGGTMPPKLSFSVIFSKLAEVNHYVSHAIPVRDVQKIIADPRLRSAIETAPDGIGGPEAYKQLMPWLQEIAKPRVDPMSITESILKTLRRNTTTVALGMKFSVAMFQWLGTTQSIEAVGYNQFVKGLLDFYTHRADMVEAIKAKSPEMANRAQSWDRELNDAYGRLGIENFRGSQLLKDAYFSMISLMDMAVAYPTWQAAFDKGMKDFNGDESKAIYFADMKVRNSQGNALPKDLAAIQRGSELKKFVTMFYTFFSAMNNQIAEANAKFKHGEKNIVELIKSWWWIVIAPAILGYMMKEREVPGPKDIVKQSIQYRLGGYPVLRDIASPVFTDYDYQFSPVARFGEVAGKALNETINLPTEERDFDKFFQYSFETLGYIKGLPTGQALITIKGFNDLKNGETSDLTQLLLRGPSEDSE